LKLIKKKEKKVEQKILMSRSLLKKWIKKWKNKVKVLWSYNITHKVKKTDNNILDINLHLDLEWIAVNHYQKANNLENKEIKKEAENKNHKTKS
jgi:hypothetical protein